MSPFIFINRFGSIINIRPSLYSLSFDIVSGQFWTLDVSRDKVLRIAFDGSVTRSLLLPDKLDDETLIRGQGISFDNEALVLYITYGSILDQGASKIIQLSTDGVLLNGEQSAERTGVEVPLDQVPEIDLRGIVPYLVGAGQKRIAVLGGSGRIYQLEQVIPGVIPPSQLSCSLTITSEVVLNWTNNGPGVDDAYEGSIQLSLIHISEPTRLGKIT